MYNDLITFHFISLPYITVWIYITWFWFIDVESIHAFPSSTSVTSLHHTVTYI